MKQNARNVESIPNAAIRRYAWQVYWKNRRLLWNIYFLYFIFISAVFLLNLYVIKDSLTSRVFEFILYFITCPVTLFSMSNIMLRLLARKPTKISILFTIFKPPYQIKTLYSASLIMCFSYILNIAIQLVQIPVSDVIFTSGIRVVYGFLISFAVIWVLLRLFLFPYLIILHPDKSAWSLCKKSFQMMKGQVGHLLWFYITIYVLPVLLFIAAVALYVTININSDPLPPFTGYAIVYGFVLLLINPFLSLAHAGYANKLLDENISEGA